jgi:hypothetical protein
MALPSQTTQGLPQAAARPLSSVAGHVS